MSYPDFDAIDPRRSIVWLPFDGQWKQGVGSNLLSNGDFEAGTTGWLPQNSVLTVVPGAPGGVGTQVLNSAAGGGTGYANGGIVLTTNFYYEVAGYGRTLDGGQPAFGDGSLVTNWWTGTTSASWQYNKSISKAANPAFFLTVLGGSKTGQFDDLVILEAPQVCRSLSKLPGVLNYARLGEGHTASTMPTQRAGRGLVFDGAQYCDLDWAAGGALDTQTFTFLCYCRPTSFSTASRLYEIGVVGGRYVFYFNGSTELRFLRDGASDVTMVVTEGFGAGEDFVFAVTLDSSGCLVYIDGAVVASVAGDIRLPSFSGLAQAMLGTYPGSPGVATSGFRGDMYSAAIYPFVLTQTQVREWGRRARQMRNI